jgi:hypothetical protein
LLGQGDFLVVAKGQVTRMQAAYVSAREVRKLVGQMLDKSSPSRSLILAPAGTGGHREGGLSLAERLRQQAQWRRLLPQPRMWSRQPQIK